jgi:hypothetical protein
MDFQPYSEVVLPPDKGTGIRREKRKPREKQSLAAPKEYKRSADSIAIDIVQPDEVLTQGERDKIIPSSEQKADASQQPAILDPTDNPDASSIHKKGKGVTPPPESEVPAAPAGSSLPAATSDQGLASNDATPSTAPTAKKTTTTSPSNDTPKDFIVAYDGRFIGHFRSEKRISNRKVFEKTARRLQEGFDEFDIRLLEIYKPVKLKVDTPEDMSKIGEGAFQWF